MCFTLVAVSATVKMKNGEHDISYPSLPSNWLLLSTTIIIAATTTTTTCPFCVGGNVTSLFFFNYSSIASHMLLTPLQLVIGISLVQLGDKYILAPVIILFKKFSNCPHQAYEAHIQFPLLLSRLWLKKSSLRIPTWILTQKQAQAWTHFSQWLTIGWFILMARTGVGDNGEAVWGEGGQWCSHTLAQGGC